VSDLQRALLGFVKGSSESYANTLREQSKFESEQRSADAQLARQKNLARHSQQLTQETAKYQQGLTQENAKYQQGLTQENARYQQTLEQENAAYKSQLKEGTDIAAEKRAEERTKRAEGRRLTQLGVELAMKSQAEIDTMKKKQELTKEWKNDNREEVIQNLKDQGFNEKAIAAATLQMDGVDLVAMSKFASGGGKGASASIKLDIEKLARSSAEKEAETLGLEGEKYSTYVSEHTRIDAQDMLSRIQTANPSLYDVLTAEPKKTAGDMQDEYLAKYKAASPEDQKIMESALSADQKMSLYKMLGKKVSYGQEVALYH